MTDTAKKSVPERVKDSAGAAAEDLRENVEEKLKQQAETARDTAADELRKHADAADAAATELDAGSMQAQAIEQVAARIDDLADRLRSTDIDRVAHAIGDAARRNPLLFVAGAALAGFAATRFLKARDPRTYPADLSYDPWSGAGAHEGSAYRPAGSTDLASRGAI